MDARRRTRWWRPIALAVAMMMAGTACQSGGADAAAVRTGTGDDRPTVPSESPTRTATGSHRPGLTRAGLVSLTELGDARLWLGLTSGQDRDVKFDVQVELLNNGTPVGSGQARCIGGLSTSRRHATEVTVPWDELDPESLEVGDVLSLRVSTRLGTSADGSRCGRARSAEGLRLYFGSAQHASGFAATIAPDPSADLYLGTDRTRCRRGSGRHEPALSLVEDAPSGRRTACQDSDALAIRGGNLWTEVGRWSLAPQCDCANELIPEVRDNPPAPAPENVELERVALPPPPTDGVCDLAVNPQGCVTSVGQAGGFIDPNHATTNVTFGGAPGTPFTGSHFVVIKLNGVFENGTPWKCLTCGIPAANRQGLEPGTGGYPQPFNDGYRVLLGDTILECDEPLVSEGCTPDNTFRYPIRWNTSPDGSGAGGSMRELRIHPDDVHLGWSSFVVGGTKLDQFMYYGRLEFNPAPATGSPTVPRYDLVSVNLMYDPDQPGPAWPDPDNPDQLDLDPLAQEVGEFRRFSKDGKWASYVGYPSGSNRIDMFMIHLETGEVRQLTRHPEYTDPMDFSYDDEWGVYLDTRGSGRQMFMGAMPGVPALNDLITSGVVSSVRNEGERRFFQPILIDVHGDRGDYEGQALKDSCPAGPEPGSLCDPDWNAGADPHFSPDGTAIVYRERNNGDTTIEPGGRNTRLVIAHLVDREPHPYTPPDPAPDTIPWATPYTPGDPAPFRSTLLPPEGTYTLEGTTLGRAEVTITHDTESGPTPVVGEVAVSYDNFSNDGINVLNGTERVIRLPAPQSTAFAPALEWHSDLTLSGCQQGTKVTSPEGFRIRINVLENHLYTSGDLVTTIDGVSWHKPETSLPF